jgi:uncharacterized protein YkwD
MFFKKISPLPISFWGILLALVLTPFLIKDISAQSRTEGNKVRTVYVTSTASGRVKAKQPGIRIVKSSNSIKDTKSDKTSTSLDLEKKTFRLINQKRGENGLQPLIWSEKIAALARVHSKNMAEYKFFSHKGLNGRLVDERAIDFGINRWQAISENIAFNRGFANPAEFAVERWMISTPHRVNLLNNRWQESGIGLAIAPDGSHYFTQIFLDAE